MTTNYATLNIQLTHERTDKKARVAFRKFLAKAVRNSFGDEHIITYDEAENQLSLGIPVTRDGELGILQAGAILGGCLEQYFAADLDDGFHFWHSVNAADGSIIESVKS